MGVPDQGLLESAIRPAMVGRDDERARGGELASDAAAGGGRLLLIEGEPGIGKTLLLRTILDDAADLIPHVVVGAAEELDQRLASACASLGAPDRAVEELDAALATGELTLAEKARFSGLLARCYSNLTRPADATPAWQESIAAARASGDTETLAYGTAAASASRTWDGRIEEALAFASTAARATESLGPRAGAQLPPHLQIGVCLAELDRDAEADQALETALRMAEQGIGTDYLIWGYNCIARLRFWQGRWRMFARPARWSIEVGITGRPKGHAMRTNRTPDRIDVVVAGAGQAGLAVSYYLQAFGVEHVVLERDRIAESWRSARWDSFTLVTPHWMTRLPGCALEPGSGRDFLPRDRVVTMLERFGRGLPVRTGVEVTSVTLAGSGYQVATSAGRIAARVVVVAGGGQRRPLIPALAVGLPEHVHQSDASRYRSPAAVPPGAVLVVGSGQSGAQIADELAGAGRDVLLATGRVPRVPRRYRDRDVHEWTVELGLYDQPTEAVSDPAELTEAHPMLSGGRGGHTLSYQQLARDGIRLLGRLVDVHEDRLWFGPDLPANIGYADRRAAGFRRAVDDYVTRVGIRAPAPDVDPAERPEPGSENSPEILSLRAEGISTVIWCTGFGPDTGWLHVPVLRPDGSPAHTRGITAFPGLYVAGYPWLSNRGSGILYGVAADAARIAQHIASDARGVGAEPLALTHHEIQSVGAQR